MRGGEETILYLPSVTSAVFMRMQNSIQHPNSRYPGNANKNAVLTKETAGGGTDRYCWGETTKMCALGCRPHYYTACNTLRAQTLQKGLPLEGVTIVYIKGTGWVENSLLWCDGNSQNRARCDR